MGETLTIEYDKIGDILFIDECRPYAEQDSNEIGESLLARFNLETGEIETIEVLFFFSWLKKEGEIRIPVSAAMRPANTALLATTAPSSGDATLTIRYDQPADTLTLEQNPPHPGQDRREICEGVSAGTNAETGEIECLEIRSFKARTERDGKIVLPIQAALRLAGQAVATD